MRRTTHASTTNAKISPIHVHADSITTRWSLSPEANGMIGKSQLPTPATETQPVASLIIDGRHAAGNHEGAAIPAGIWHGSQSGT